MHTLPSIEQSPTAPEFLAAPYAFYDRARALGDFVYWEDFGIPVATSYEAVKAILSHQAVGREAPHWARTYRATHLSTYHRVEDHSLLKLEGAEHARLKGVIANALSNDAILSLTPVISQKCDELISGFPTGTPFDLQSTYADKVPGWVLMTLLGFPTDMQELFKSWARDIDSLFDANRDRTTEEKAEKAYIAYEAFMTKHLATLRAKGGSDDMVGRIVASQKTLADEEITALVLVTLQAASSATAYAIGTSFMTLSNCKDQKLALAPENIQSTIEECLRFEPPIRVLKRYVLEDVTLLDSGFQRDTQIGCLIGSACHDDAVWPDGNTFDPFRASRPHLAFGAGAHACLGNSLASMILTIALPALFSRCPTIEIAAEPTFASESVFRGLDRLEVRL